MREAVARCDVQEFQLWRAFYKLHPWGPDADDIRAAQLANLTHQAAGGKSKVEDFRLGTRADPPAFNPKHLLAQVKAQQMEQRFHEAMAAGRKKDRARRVAEQAK